MTREINTKVGFVGLGKMGQPMARRVHAAGVLVAVHDLRAEVVSAFSNDLGVAAAPSLQELGHTCGVVVLMLPNGQIVRDVILGDGNDGSDCLTATPGDGLVIVDMSSSAPMGTRSLSQSLSDQGVELLDAPVSGGVKKARTGKLSIMVGGDPGLTKQVRWLLELMGERIFAAGPSGSGHALKALNNYVSAAGFAAAAEALRIANDFGIDNDVVIDVLNASTGRNNSTENKFKQYVLSGAYDSGFALDLMAKDVATANELARQTDVFAPLIKHCSDAWLDASKQLDKSGDHTEYFRYLSETKK